MSRETHRPDAAAQVHRGCHGLDLEITDCGAATLSDVGATGSGNGVLLPGQGCVSPVSHLVTSDPGRVDRRTYIMKTARNGA